MIFVILVRSASPIRFPIDFALPFGLVVILRSLLYSELVHLVALHHSPYGSIQKAARQSSRHPTGLRGRHKRHSFLWLDPSRQAFAKVAVKSVEIAIYPS